VTRKYNDTTTTAAEYQQIKENLDNLAQHLIFVPYCVQNLAILLRSYDLKGKGDEEVSKEAQPVLYGIKAFRNAQDNSYQILMTLGRINSNAREIIYRLEERNPDAFSYPLAQIANYTSSCANRAAVVIQSFHTAEKSVAADHNVIQGYEKMLLFWRAIKDFFDDITSKLASKDKWSRTGSFTDHRDFAVRVGMLVVKTEIILSQYNIVSTDHVVKHTRVLDMMISSTKNISPERFDQIEAQCVSAKAAVGGYLNANRVDERKIRDNLSSQLAK